jgi:hypothetical protein
MATVARFGGGGNAEAILDCLFMGEDQKRLAASQNGAFYPKRSSPKMLAEGEVGGVRLDDGHHGEFHGCAPAA